MSNTSSYTLKEFTLMESISIDHGTKFVTITYIDGRKMGSPGWSTVIELTPELALDISRNIKRRALEIKPSLSIED